MDEEQFTLPADQEAIVARFSAMTGLSTMDASAFLHHHGWDAEAAANDFFSSGADGNEGQDDDTPQPTQGSSSSYNTAATSKPSQKKFATMGDLSQEGGHQHDDDSDSDDDSEHDLFAGGEKSGLAVQNPNDLKRKVLEQARQHGRRMREEAPPQSSNFRGPAQTLGGDDAPSRSVDDPEANRPPAPQVVKRRLHFWENGFSVDDGPLYDINKPENAEILKMIHKGRAPLNIMNVEPNSEVDVSVEEHHGPYVQPKQKYQPFAGQGQRLGSPTVSAQGEPAAPRLNNPPRSQSGAQSAPVTIDSDQPTISLQIRLGDGTRLVSRFNTTHTIGDVYEFVSASSPASSARPWALMTTFPSRELTDMTVQLGDTSDLKKGGVVVQKWK